MPSLLLSPAGPSTMNFFSTSMPLLPSFLFRNRKKCYDLNPPEEHRQVTYLGNMLTIIGKGDTCVDRPLEVITRAWSAAGGGMRTNKSGATNGSPQQQQQLTMRLSVCRSGIRAETCMGATEYFAHRITWSAAPSQYPRVFCWIYKHEGKRMKPELRCHAVLCRRADEPRLIHETLRKHLQFALQEYKREKVAAQRTRQRHNNVLLHAAAAAACSANGAGCCCGAIEPHTQQRQLSRRKAFLQTGTLNFRPPLSRSRSVPRLCSIDEEEARGEEDEEDDQNDDDEDDDEQHVSSSDVDSLNTADHYQPMPVPTTVSSSSDRTTASSDDGTTTDSCRSSACDEEEGELFEQQGHDEAEGVGGEHRRRLQQRHIVSRTTTTGREDGDDGCSADSGYSVHA